MSVAEEIVDDSEGEDEDFLLLTGIENTKENTLEITEDTNIRLIAVIMPNDRSVGQDWSEFRVTVKEVEKLTRFKFFDKVNSDVINPLKGVEDDIPVPPPAPVHH